MNRCKLCQNKVGNAGRWTVSGSTVVHAEGGCRWSKVKRESKAGVKVQKSKAKAERHGHKAAAGDGARACKVCGGGAVKGRLSRNGQRVMHSETCRFVSERLLAAHKAGVNPEDFNQTINVAQRNPKATAQKRSTKHVRNTNARTFRFVQPVI